MKLFTKQIDNQLFSQYSLGADLSKQKVVAKIFNPYGRGTWYLINSDPSDSDYLWAIVDLFEVEVGSVSRMELETIKVPPFRLGLERDMSFTPKNAQEVYDGLLEGKRFEQGGSLEDENKQMVLNQAEGFEHHSEELEEAAKKADHVPAWVVAQSAVASSKLSDITHYLDGENEQKREMREGEEYADSGYMAKGGVIGNYELMPYIKGVNDTYNPKYQAKEYFEGTKDDAIEKANSILSAEIGMVQVSIVNPKATNVLNRTKKIATVVYKDGGMMAKGGNIYGIEKYLSRNLINHITSLNEEQLKKMKKELQGEIDRSEKYEKDFKGSNREFALKKELDLVNYRLEDEMAMGGYMAEGGEVKYGTTPKADEEGYFYIIDLETKRKLKSSEIPSDLGYGNIENKFISTKKVYGNKELRLQEAIYIAMKMNSRDEMAMGGETFDDEYYIIIKNPKGLVTNKGYYGMGYNKKEIINLFEEKGLKYNEKGEKFGGQALEEYEFFLKKPTKYDIQLPKKMAMGGETFDSKVKSIKSSLLKRKKVSPKVQKDYGKTYSPKEAEESAKRIVGAMTAKERLMKSMKKGKK